MSCERNCESLIIFTLVSYAPHSTNVFFTSCKVGGVWVSWVR